MESSKEMLSNSRIRELAIITESCREIRDCASRMESVSRNKSRLEPDEELELLIGYGGLKTAMRVLTGQAEKLFYMRKEDEMERMDEALRH